MSETAANEKTLADHWKAFTRFMRLEGDDHLSRVAFYTGAIAVCRLMSDSSCDPAAVMREVEAFAGEMVSLLQSQEKGCGRD